MSVTTLIDELIALFNRRSMDVPDRLFSRQTQFVLNGTPFEARLGRPATDPLVLMLARGAAGYRFTAMAVRHAIPDGTLQRGELRERTGERTTTVTGQAWLSGHLRGSGEPIELLLDVAIDLAGLTAMRIAVMVGDQDLARVQEARLRS